MRSKVRGRQTSRLPHCYRTDTHVAAFLCHPGSLFVSPRPKSRGPAETFWLTFSFSNTRAGPRVKPGVTSRCAQIWLRFTSLFEIACRPNCLRFIEFRSPTFLSSPPCGRQTSRLPQPSDGHTRACAAHGKRLDSGRRRNDISQA
jgi:hypothetical protein